MAAIATSPAATERSLGRPYFWAGVGVCLLGLAVAVAQVSLKYLFVPWYSPVLATLGAFLLLGALARRRSIPRVIALVLVAACAGLQWYLLVALMKLPSYEGPAQAGKQLPAFSATLADGRAFTEADFQDGSRRVMVFFRGRW
jgi:arginine exporter protein ArgO